MSENKKDKSRPVKGDTLELTFRYPIRVGFLPDIHGGETRAITLDEFETEEGQKIVPNKIQEILRKLWLRNIELFKKYAVQYIFVIGDAFGGANPAESGAFMSMLRPDQVKLTTQLLEEVWIGCDKKPIFFIWSGTQYHESRKGESNMHEQLVENLRAKGIPAIYMKDISYVELFGGKDSITDKERTRRIFIAHEAPTGLVYTATLMSRDISWASESEATGSSLPVDAIVRGHLHHWLHVDHSGKHAVQLPCWLAHVPYKQTIKYFFKLQPTLGGALMLMDEYGRLDFWGGSYPFSLNREEKLELNKLTVTMIGLDPKNQKHYLEREELDKRKKNPEMSEDYKEKTKKLIQRRKY